MSRRLDVLDWWQYYWNCLLMISKSLDLNTHVSIGNLLSSFKFLSGKIWLLIVINWEGNSSQYLQSLAFWRDNLFSWAYFCYSFYYRVIKLTSPNINLVTCAGCVLSLLSIPLLGIERPITNNLTFISSLQQVTFSLYLKENNKLIFNSLTRFSALDIFDVSQMIIIRQFSTMCRKRKHKTMCLSSIKGPDRVGRHINLLALHSKSISKGCSPHFYVMLFTVACVLTW